MKKFFLIKNPILFQGSKYLESNKNYFEGWYFKHSNNNTNISFIPGININELEKKAFIQVITNNNSFFINYDINDFSYNDNPFYIRIKNNYFSKEKIIIDINDLSQNINITGTIINQNNQEIKTSLLYPNIMGPFSYLPFMECNHAVLSMKNITNGYIYFNDETIDLNNGCGYIEKDWGTSFPKSYIWCQGNNFKDHSTSFMLSIADIPLSKFKFNGLICILIINDTEYRFTTYNNSKILEYDTSDNYLNIVIKKGNLKLYIESNYEQGQKLSAPVKGKMQKSIYESIKENITITLMKNDNVIYKDTSTNCGLEIVYK